MAIFLYLLDEVECGERIWVTVYAESWSPAIENGSFKSFLIAKFKFAALTEEAHCFLRLWTFNLADLIDNLFKQVHSFILLFLKFHLFDVVAESFILVATGDVVV